MELDFNKTKYGRAEISKIKKFFETKEVRVVHAFHQVMKTMPCISIQLFRDDEDGAAVLGDEADQLIEVETDVEDIAARTIVSAVTPTAYDSATGKVDVPDSVNLTNVTANNLFVDSAGTQHSILGGIDNTTGSKKFFIAKDATVVLGAGFIRSSINFKQFEEKVIMDAEQLLLGIHTQEPLLTKYLYTTLKYILMSRKVDLIVRGLKRLTFSGSDFTRNLNYGEEVFSRYLTLRGLTENRFKHQEVTPIESTQITVLVDKDIATSTQLGQENQSVKVNDNDTDDC